ncbi:hypothetical protein CNMCM8686_008802 [Aspergillus fumigatus]|nr:hypothetical protein CNMCM8686_008802 [Aspergillus fumigatus]
MRTEHRRRASSVESTRLEMRSARSKRSDTRSDCLSLNSTSRSTSGWACMKGGSMGARCVTPNDMGAARRILPRRLVDFSVTSASTASPSSRMRAARSSAA